MCVTEFVYSGVHHPLQPNIPNRACTDLSTFNRKVTVAAVNVLHGEPVRRILESRSSGPQDISEA